MTKLQQVPESSKSIINDADFFFDTFRIGLILQRVNASKTQGFSGRQVLLALLMSVFSRLSLSEALSDASNSFGFGKDVVYRFLNNPKTNWENLLFNVSRHVIDFAKSLTAGCRIKALIVDDTSYYRDRSSKVELLSRCYDHAQDRFYKGFNMLTIGWSDGVSFFPLQSKLLCASSKKNLLCASDCPVDRRTLATKRRDEAFLGKPQIVLKTLKRLSQAEQIATHVLFDSWFSFPDMIMSIKEIGYDVVCRMKNTAKQTFLFNGMKRTLSQIYKACKKRRGRSHYLLSVPVTLSHEEHEQNISAKCVYVRNRNRPKDWIAILSTDTSLSEEEIIQLYGRRWEIETFFKTCKSYLRLTSDYQGRSYDGITAHATIVLLRYIFLVFEHRRTEDKRTLGRLFAATSAELPQITYSTALNYCLQEMINVVSEFYGLNETIIDGLVEQFKRRLPLPYQQMLVFQGCET